MTRHNSFCTFRVSAMSVQVEIIALFEYTMSCATNKWGRHMMRTDDTFSPRAHPDGRAQRRCAATDLLLREDISGRL